MSEDHSLVFLGHEPLENKTLRITCACGWTSKLSFGKEFLAQGVTEARAILKISHDQHVMHQEGEEVVG